MGTNKPTLGHCRDCQAPIMFAKHVRTGFDNKLDIQPHPNGNALVDRQLMRYEFLTGKDLERARAEKRQLYIAHAATCSQKESLAETGQGREVTRV